MTNSALRTAVDYWNAWTGKDVDAAMKYIADDIVCDAPSGRLEGSLAYRRFLEPFARELLLDATLLAAMGDGDTAVLVYGTRTVATDSAPAAEYVTVHDGRIVSSRFIFDRLPFVEIERNQAGN